MCLGNVKSTTFNINNILMHYLPIDFQRLFMILPLNARPNNVLHHPSPAGRDVTDLQKRRLVHQCRRLDSVLQSSDPAECVAAIMRQNGHESRTSCHLFSQSMPLSHTFVITRRQLRAFTEHPEKVRSKLRDYSLHWTWVLLTFN